MKQKKSQTKIRYAVIGQGYFAQSAVLPAFAHAKSNSVLTTLFSEDPKKLAKLGKKYGAEHTLSYDDYDAFLTEGNVDAIYIALPNSLHCEYAVRAAEAGVHVLCEKPMAVTEDECDKMIRACASHGTKLMVGYRLHFERSNLRAVELVKDGKLGEPRIFNSVFTMQVAEGNIRLDGDLGGGPIFDIGIYCINAARYLFREEPTELFAFSGRPQGAGNKRFAEVEEQVSCVLRFPKGRLASFTVGFGAADVSAYDVVGTKGTLRADPAYEFHGELKHQLKIGKRSKETVFRPRDQVAPELIYFSDCIRTGRQPEPSGQEGLTDVRIITAIYESLASNRPVALELSEKTKRPNMDMERERPPVGRNKLVNAAEPSP